MHHPTNRIAHTTAFVTPIMEHLLERELAQLVHHEESICRPIVPWADALTTDPQTEQYITFVNNRFRIGDGKLPCNSPTGKRTGKKTNNIINAQEAGNELLRCM